MTILVYDSRKLIADSIAQLLNAVTCTHNPEEAVHKLQPEISIVTVPENYDVIRRIKYHTKIIALSLNNERMHLQDSLAAGADAYIHFGCTKDEILSCVGYMQKGYKYIHPSVTDIIIDNIRPSNKFGLSDRETEIISLISQGLTITEIADRLFISKKTVNSHKLTIYHKLDLHSTKEIVKFGIQNNLI